MEIRQQRFQNAPMVREFHILIALLGKRLQRDVKMEKLLVTELIKCGNPPTDVPV